MSLRPEEIKKLLDDKDVSLRHAFNELLHQRDEARKEAERHLARVSVAEARLTELSEAAADLANNVSIHSDEMCSRTDYCDRREEGKECTFHEDSPCPECNCGSKTPGLRARVLAVIANVRGQ